METIGTSRSYVRPLRVRCHDDFRGPVRAVEVRLEPGADAVVDTRTHVFNVDRPQDWQVSLSRTPAPPVARCVLHLQVGDGLDRPASLDRVLPLDADQAFLDIVPAGLFADRRFPIDVATAFPWWLVRSVEVSLGGAGLHFSPPTIELDERGPSGVIEAFSPQPDDFAGVTCEFVVHPVDGAAPLRLSGGLPAGGAVFVNPLARRDVVVRLGPGFDWSGRSSVELCVVPGPLQLWPETVFTLHPESALPVLRYWHAGDRAFALGVGAAPPVAIPSGSPPLVVLPFTSPQETSHDLHA